MKLPRRQFLHLAAGAAALPAVSSIARAQTYPTRPVRWIVGQYLSERLHQPVIIENRPGAAGNTATELVVNASPDGHTLLLISALNTVNVTSTRDLITISSAT